MQSKSSKIKIIHIVIIVLGIIFLNMSIFHDNIWFDESYSVGIANHSFIDIWNIGGHDVHPVLYYWILHIISIFTNSSIMAYRIFSGFVISITGILGYTHIRKDFGEKAGAIFSFLIFFSPITGMFANEIRMYALVMFLITVLSIYAFRLAKESKLVYWIIFGLSSLCSIYTHYYGLMAAGIINLILLFYFIKNQKKKSYIIQIIIGVIQALLYLPWMIYFSSQLNTMASNGFWISITFPDTLIEILGFQFAGNLNIYIGLAISILIYGISIYIFKKTGGVKNNIPVVIILSVWGLVIIAALIMSLILTQAILYYRYLFALTGVFFLALSILLAKGKTIFTIIVCIIIFIAGCVNNIQMIIENYDSTNDNPFEYIESNMEEGDIIAYSNIGSGSVLAVKFPNNKQYFYNGADWGVEEAYKAFGPQMETWVTEDFIENCKGRVWVEGKSFYKDHFDNENYELILHESFETAYEDYYYDLYLVEYVGED